MKCICILERIHLCNTHCGEQNTTWLWLDSFNSKLCLHTFHFVSTSFVSREALLKFPFHRNQFLNGPFPRNDTTSADRHFDWLCEVTSSLVDLLVYQFESLTVIAIFSTTGYKSHLLSRQWWGRRSLCRRRGCRVWSQITWRNINNNKLYYQIKKLDIYLLVQKG